MLACVLHLVEGCGDEEAAWDLLLPPLFAVREQVTLFRLLILATAASANAATTAAGQRDPESADCARVERGAVLLRLCLRVLRLVAEQPHIAAHASLRTKPALAALRSVFARALLLCGGQQQQQQWLDPLAVLDEESGCALVRTAIAGVKPWNIALTTHLISVCSQANAHTRNRKHTKRSKSVCLCVSERRECVGEGRGESRRVCVGKSVCEREWEKQEWGFACHISALAQ